ncbi:MAG TPA: fructosamine kinase family protein [Frankiaceae bacterium]|nr:fructosamine kinase family protein [Frankiaceae bacterium]
MIPGLAHATSVGGGSICDAYRGEWRGRTVFAKTLRHPPRGFFEAEEHGLRWLGAVGAPVPEVLHVAADVLILEWVEAGSPTRAAAERFGRDLADLHACNAPAFGAGWPGYIGSLPMDNATTYAAPDEWPAFYTEQRVLPFLRLAVDDGAIDDRGQRAVEEVCERLADLAGPPEPPRHIHGDLWSGNVLWTGKGRGVADGRVRLIDPAAHGGHRETDLAMLALFGFPQLDAVLGAYRERFPLADGWEQRRDLHQLHPLLVHAALFGRSYGSRVTSLARRLLS